MTLDPEESGTKCTLTCSIFPHSSRIFMLHAFTAAHEWKHTKGEKNTQAHGNAPRYLFMRFLCLKPAASAWCVGVHQCEICFASMARDPHCSRQRQGRSGSWRGKLYRKHRNIMILRLWRHADFIISMWGCLDCQICTGAYKGGKKDFDATFSFGQITDSF